MDGKNLDIVRQKIEQLKQIIPEAFTEGKIDWEKLKITLGENIEFSNERYVLNWAGKTNAYRLLQAPTYATLKPAKEESVNFDTTENIFIEGDNLEVLKVLQKSYFGKIKMIYIDPPYNTGNDFIYKDDFKETIQEYRKKIGDVDENGNLKGARLFRNTKDNGRYHSNWLNMMLPRLFLARNLLRDDGVIFVSIDDNEVHNLRLLMDEIFGEENFVAIFPWRKRTAKSDVPFGISQDYEWIICYSKGDNFFAAIEGNKRKYYETPDFPNRPWRIHEMTTHRTASERPNSFFTLINPKTGEEYPANPNSVWRVTKESFKKFYKQHRIVFPGDYEFLNITKPVMRYFKDEDQNKEGNRFGYLTISTHLPKEIGMTLDGTKEISRLFEEKIFSFPKPISLISYLIKVSTAIDKTGIILDFFAGSGTTAHAVMELNKEDGGNRKFILVQLPEPCDENSEAYKAGFKTIADICKERIRRAGKKIQKDLEEEKKKKQEEIEFGPHITTKEEGKEPPLNPPKEWTFDYGFKVFKLSESNFKQWRLLNTNKPEEIEEAILKFKDNIKSDTTTENILFELILKTGKTLTEKIEKKNNYYVVGKNEIVFILETINDSMIDEILKLKPQKVIVLDKLFSGNDQLKTNIYQQFKDAAIEFKSM
jgi:adenine-specific DNA-methyltransferase